MPPETPPPTAPAPGPPLAYHNLAFLDSDAARPIRIVTEYIEPYDTFQRESVRDTIVFFGSARITPDGPLARYYHEARELARLVTAWSQRLVCPSECFIVCSGGGPGIMEAANRGAADAGGRTIGLNIGLPHEQRPNAWVTPELSFQFHYFFMRKLWFAHLARAMVAFPGGFGTLDELFEILCLVQTGKIARDIPVLLYGSDYWKSLINFDVLVRHGTIAPADLELFHFVDSPAAAFAMLEHSLAPAFEHPGPRIAKSVTPANAHPHRHVRARRA
ncbi:MAG TPA: TIGR00730 family Rossman fold protein [Candidatus Eisenbacteria bacterium]|nr:TIGR00730 family Rossman fold protein [Candidatus Eisenbacteria bacterium]